MKIRMNNNTGGGFFYEVLKTVRYGAIQKIGIESLSRRLIILLFLTSILFSASMIAYSQNILALTNGTDKPMTIDITNILTASNLTNTSEYPTGYLPITNDPSALNKGKQVTFGGIQPLISYPNKYDLRQMNKVTSVKNQGYANTCWAFATYGSLESYLLPSENWNFSVNNLKNTYGYDFQPNGPGNQFISTGYLTRWSGPVKESDDPYDPNNTTSPPNLPIQKHVQEVFYLPARANATDNNNIKWAIMNYGGVFSGMYIYGGALGNPQYTDSYYNAATYGYYYTYGFPPPGTNHAITIVGWDDNYSRYNFSTVPPGDGAWIVQNSYGTSWGNNGYFYISYYDSFTGCSNAVFTAAPLTNYDNIYQYDPYGWVYGMVLDNTYNPEWFANVYTTNSSENLTAVGFYTVNMSTSYEVDIYKDPINGPINPAGYVEAVTGTINMPGYHTINLTTPIPLNASEKFSAVVKQMVQPGDGVEITVQFRCPNWSDGARAGLGEGYYSTDGRTWTDVVSQFSNVSFNLKAYTTSSHNNIIQNPGFEQGWNNWRNWTYGTSGSNEIVSNTSHSGIYSLHLAKSGYTSGAFGVSTDVYSVTPGNVQLTLWAKGSKSGTVYVKIQSYDANNNFLSTGQFSLGSVTSNWGQQTFTWTYPANTAKTRVDIAVQCNSDLYFDDFSLVKT